VVKLPGIGLDVDTPEDLLELIAFLETTGVVSGTHHYLQSSGIIARLFQDGENLLDEMKQDQTR
jgi:hypothetical protein